MKNPKSIGSLFALPGFVAAAKLHGVYGDRYARVITLRRRKKQPSVQTVVIAAGDVTTKKSCGHEISRLLDGGSTWSSNVGESIAGSVVACM